MLTWSGLRLARSRVAVSPATENTRSDVVSVAGICKYFCAKMLSLLNVVTFFDRSVGKNRKHFVTNSEMSVGKNRKTGEGKIIEYSNMKSVFEYFIHS
jgi:hypothetical protein